MKKLDTNKLTEKQADLFKNNLVYIATVDENGNPQVGPKGSMTVLDPSQQLHMFMKMMNMQRKSYLVLILLMHL